MIEKVARIVWLSAEQGGRASPPSGPRYTAPAGFGAAGSSAGDANWRLVVDLIDRRPDSSEWTANVRFLASEAPSELLADGARFSLFEGKKCVAYGEIMPTFTTNDARQPAIIPQEARH